jgi:DNA mismatch repair protein MutS
VKPTKKATKKSGKVTPLMQQYFQVKAKHPDAILLFRVGDFYETFGEDAEKAAGILGIVLTSRNNGGSDIPLAGFPYHSKDVYLPKLVKAGYRVAICEQLEKPSKEKKIVKRGVTDIVTPGLTLDDSLLDQSSNNFLASIHFGKNDIIGIAFLDISTGEFIVSEGKIAKIEKLIQSFHPTEIIFSKQYRDRFETIFGQSYYSYHLPEWVYTEDHTLELLLNQFAVNNLKGFGIESMAAAQVAAGACLHYVNTTEKTQVEHIKKIVRIENDQYVWLDRFTIRNLELVRSNHESGVALIDILDQTVSPMGARRMKHWIVLPLKDTHQIKRRQAVVTHFMEHIDDEQTVTDHLKKIGDLERLISKLALERIQPREVRQLHKALEATEPIHDLLLNSKNDVLKELSDQLSLCKEMKQRIDTTIMEEPPALLIKGSVIADGVNEELDGYRHIIKNSKELLVDIQTEEATKTGIANLKIGFNNVFGYYLEVTNKYKNQGLIPDNWVRKQTLTNAERYITDELKLLETKILNAQESVQELELTIYESLIKDLKEYITPLQTNGRVLSIIDCLQSFSQTAREKRYCRPEVNESLVIDIKDGRHPVIETQLSVDEEYIPNDILLDNEDQQVIMITGPNMSGKSAILRQTALITLMAQMGSFVPAREASIGYVDKLFTRVGASDNISSGESTFMVEMNETASIINNVSPRSLILLDEIGRGTSTYDGISIAWSLAEFLHNHPHAHPKTLFATHYHELNELAESYHRIRNYHVSTKELKNKVLFLRKLVPGGSHHSFGIHVAKMAGMPQSIIRRANEILKQLETKSIEQDKDSPTKITTPEEQSVDALQMSIFEVSDPVIGKIKEELLNVDVNAMTPIECMMKLNELIKLLEE